jgi:hypothetical protein
LYNTVVYSSSRYIRGFYFQGQFLLHEAAPGENFTITAGVFTPTAVEEFTKPFASRFFKIPIDGRPLPAEIVFCTLLMTRIVNRPLNATVADPCDVKYEVCDRVDSIHLRLLNRVEIRGQMS